MKDNDRALLVDGPRGCNVAWAQRVVDMHVVGAQVYRVVPLAHTSGTTTHLRLEVQHDAGAQFPSHWFVKSTPSRLVTRLLVCAVGLLENEARFYTQFAAQLPVSVPQCLAASATWFSGTLVLRDLCASGQQPGQAGDAFSPAQARAALRTLAALHAHGQTPSIRRAWQSSAGAMRRMEQRLGNCFALPLTRRGLKRVAQVVPERLHAPALDYARQWAAYQARLYDAAHTLVHHDCHPGNWFWREDMPGLLDWQLCRLGEGVGDVAYLLGTSLEPQSLADQEDALLQVYAEALVANGGSLPGGISHLAQRYRMHLAYAFEAMLMTVAIGGFMPLSSSLELVKRTAAAVDRNGSLTTARMWQG